MIKKQIRYLGLIVFYAFFWANFCYCEDANKGDSLSQAVKYIESNDYKKAVKELNNIINSKDISSDKKIEAYFWTAYISLNGNKKSDVRKIFNEMFNKGLGTEFKTDTLPKQLSSNSDLMKMFSEEKIFFLQSKSAVPPKAVLYIKQANILYKTGDLDEAENKIKLCLEIDAKNQEALNLRNKIWKIRTKTAEIRKIIQEEYTASAETFYKHGNDFEAMLSAKRALDIDPKDQKALSLYMQAYEKIMAIPGEGSKKDQHIFSKAVKYYLEYNFEEAAKLFRQLEPYMPGVDKLLSITTAHLGDEKNCTRAIEYYSEAVNAMKKERYRKAKEYLLLSLEMDKYFLDARLLLEQVSIELQTK